MNQIYGKEVELKNIATEKYGRILADVYYNDLSIGELLKNERLAVSYDGGKKNVPECWKKYYESKENIC